MNLVQSRQNIIKLMSDFVFQIKGTTSMGMTDLNHASETVLISLLREVYGYNDLKNLNSEQEANYPGIDLGDENARVAVQVTSTSSSEKIKKTLEKFVKFKQYEKYDRLIVYILSEKQGSYSGNGFDEIIQDQFKFDKDKDIIDYQDVLKQVSTFPLDRVRAVERILEEHFGDSNVLLHVKKEVQALREEATRETTVQTETIVVAQQEITQKQTQEISSIIEDVLRRQLSEAGIRQPTISAEETAYTAKLELTSSLLADGKAGVAQKELLKMRSESTKQTISSDSLYRIATQLGACAYELGDTDTAVRELYDALAYRPNDPAALTNAATAASLAGNSDEAISLSRKVRQLEKQSSVATSIYIAILHHQGQLNEIEQVLTNEPWIATDAMCLTTLGDLKFQDGEYEKAAQYLRDAINIDDKNPLSHLLLAQSILIPLQQSIHDDPPLPGKQENLAIAMTQEALTALTAVITLTADRDNLDMRHLALANRAGILASLGKLDEAEQDCDEVLLASKRQDTALRNKGQILLRRGAWERAIQFFLQIQGEEERESATLPLASAYKSSGNFTRVIEVLTPIWEKPSHDQNKIYLAEMLMQAYTELGETDKAAQIELDLFRNWPGNPVMLSVLASKRIAEEKPDEALTMLEQCLATTQGHSHDWILYQIAHIYYRLNNFPKAVESYKTIVDSTKNSPELREYLYSLYQTKQYQEALAVARSLRGDGAVIPMISEIEALILGEVSDWDNAAAILHQLLEIEPKNLSIPVRLIWIEMQRKDENAAKAAAQRVTFESVQDNPELLMRIAFARNSLNMPDALKFAYQAIRMAPNAADIHSGYMQLFLELNTHETAAISVGPNAMGVDCSIRLTRNGKILAFTLIDEKTVYEANGEINLSHPYAAKLSDLHTGDEIDLQDNPMGAIKYNVLEIQSKYVFAFQESIRKFETGQFHNPSIFIGDITDPEFMPNFKVNLNERRVQGEAITNAYNNNKIPLCIMAELLKRSEFEVWSALVSSQTARVNAAPPASQEWLNQTNILAGTDALLLEITSLFTIQHLGIGAEVSQAFNRLLVAQSTVDTLNRYIDQPFASLPSYSMWSEGDHLAHQEVSADQVKDQREFVQKIVQYIRNKTQVLPPTDLLTIRQDIVEELGGTAAGAIAFAYGQKVPLYTDDIVLRAIAHQNQQVPGVWTQAVLQYLHDKGILDLDQYNNALEKLIISNYAIVEVDTGLLEWMLERDDLEITPQLIRVLKTLAPLFMDERKAIITAAQIAKWVWAEPVVQQNKVSVLEAVLKALVTDRNKYHTLLKVKRELARIMHTLPFQYQELYQSIENWEYSRGD